MVMVTDYLWADERQAQVPDMCRVPGGSWAPAPYPGAAQAGASKSRREPEGGRGKKKKAGAGMRGNEFSTPFLPGGVRVHQSQQEAQRLAYSLDVKTEGKNVTRSVPHYGHGYEEDPNQQDAPPGAINSALRLHSRLKRG